MKNSYKYIVIFLISILFTLSSIYNITTNSELIIQLLLTLLGLCITAYTFVCGPISEKVSKNIELHEEAIELVKKLEEDMKAIFYLTIIIIVISVIKNSDIIFVKDPTNLDFGLFIIESLKNFLFNSMITFCFLLGLCGFYDFFDASFVLTKGLLFYKNNKNNK